MYSRCISPIFFKNGGLCINLLEQFFNKLNQNEASGVRLLGLHMLRTAMKYEQLLNIRSVIKSYLVKVHDSIRSKSIVIRIELSS